MKPLVSIVIPTYNRKKYLQESLSSALGQKYTNFEVIVLNNCSTDETESYLNSSSDSRLRVIHRKNNIGGIKNIVSSLDYVLGDYLIILSDDDLIHSELIITAVNDLEANLDSVFWFSSTSIVDKNKKIIDYIICETKKQTPLEHMSGWLSGKNMVSFCSTVYRVESLRKVGGFPDTEVLDASSRIMLLKYGTALSRKEVLSTYRRHELSDTESLNIKKWFILIDSLLDLVYDFFPEHRKYLKPLFSGYATRTLLGIVPLRAWSKFYITLSHLSFKYGLAIFVTSKPYRTLIEFLFPQVITLIRRKKLKATSFQ